MSLVLLKQTVDTNELTIFLGENITSKRHDHYRGQDVSGLLIKATTQKMTYQLEDTTELACYFSPSALIVANFLASQYIMLAGAMEI